MTRIASGNISVIIQGPARRTGPSGTAFDVRDSIASVRMHLPDAEIIVSTWRGEAPQDATGIVVIESELPPAIEDANGNDNNINRQLVSTIAGLQAATRPYALKLRSDVALTGAGIAEVVDSDMARRSPFRRLRSPITVTNIFTRDPVRIPMLFHLSDTVHFGLTADLRDYWNRPAFEQTWLRSPSGPRRNPFGTYAGYTDMQRTPEQALCLAWLRRKGIDVDISHVCDGDRNRLQLWERVLIANFHLVPWQDAQLQFPTRFTRGHYTHDMIYDRKTFKWLESHIEAPAYNGRVIRYYLNKYLHNFFRLSWYVSAVSVVLFSLHPGLAKRAQSLWRKRIGWNRS